MHAALRRTIIAVRFSPTSPDRRTDEEFTPSKPQQNPPSPHNPER
jgi:hypothetical protein